MSILVATDFSSCSQSAVRLAAAIARGRAVRLLVVHAVEPPMVDVASIPGGFVGWQGELLEAAQTALANEALELRDQGTTVETRIAFGGPIETVREVVRAEAPELVVLGTHGRKGAARLFLGSVAEAIVRQATCPVLVTGEGASELARWAGQEPLRLAVGTDGSSASVTALGWTGGFAATRSCDLSIIHLYWPAEAAVRYGLDDPWGGRPRGPELVKLIERDVRREADAALGRAAALRLRVASNDAAEALVDEATLLGADGVVIGIPRHRSARWTVVAPGAVLRATSVPILCIPEGAAPSQRELPLTTTILLATDFSEASREAILPAYGLLRAGGHVELCTVHALAPVTTLESPGEPPLGVEERAALEARLRSLVPPAAEAAGITTTVSVIEGRSVPETIVSAAERLGVGLLAIGSHGRTGFKRTLLGSVAEEVVRRCPLPVLVVSERGRHGRA